MGRRLKQDAGPGSIILIAVLRGQHIKNNFYCQVATRRGDSVHLVMAWRSAAAVGRRQWRQRCASWSQLKERRPLLLLLSLLLLLEM